MIQSEITDPWEIFTLGDLRQWLAENAALPDDTEINVKGEQNGDEAPLIVLAERTWRENDPTFYHD